MFLISNIENIIDNIEHKVTFGKYKGQTSEDICKYERNASWVLWADKYVKWFNLNPSIRKEVVKYYKKQNMPRKRYSCYSDDLGEEDDNPYGFGDC